MMSSVLPQFLGFTAANALHLLGIVVLALIFRQSLRRVTNAVVQSTSTPSRAAQQREQQTRAVADTIYKAGSRIIWGVALFTALPEFGINPLPAIVVAAAALLVLAIASQALVRDVVSGFYIALENQYLVGDTIQTGDVTGRVEQLTLRRTVLRDARGALVTIANREIHTVGNLSRDWSQAFVDIAIAPESPLEKALQALEAASADLRGDAAWTQALVDGPRILGVQAYDRNASTLRLQVRTAPTRQDEVCRELRRRIQLEFQRRGVASSRPQASAPLAVVETPLT
jgi:moderate conductance mechanosensitive channel